MKETIKLTIGNVYTTLEGDYQEEIVKELLTCYPTPKYFKKQKYLKYQPQPPKIRLLRKNKFPTGLLSRVLPVLPDPVIEDRRKTPKQVFLTQDLENQTLRGFQVEAVDKALKDKRGVIVIPFAGGKTYIGGAIIARLGRRSIYLVHRKELMYDVLNRLTEWLPDRKIGFCGDGQFEDGDVMVAMILSARNLDLTSYDVFIGDEIHHAPAKAYFNVLEACTAYYRIGLTGTVLGRSDGKEMLLHAATGDIIYQKSVAELRKGGYVSDAEVYMVTSEYQGTQNAETFQELEEEYLVHNAERNNWIRTICNQLKGESILIFVRRVAHGEILKKLIRDSVFVHGGICTEDRLAAIKTTGVVISTSIFEEGINAPQFDVIINAAGGKAAIPTSQRVGRGMRLGSGKKLKVFDFNDVGHSMLKRHSASRAKIYKNLGFNVKR